MIEKISTSYNSYSSVDDLTPIDKKLLKLIKMITKADLKLAVIVLATTMVALAVHQKFVAPKLAPKK